MGACSMQLLLLVADGELENDKVGTCCDTNLTNAHKTCINNTGETQ